MKELVREHALHPMKANEGLAMRIVADFHGEPAARDAHEEFQRVFRSHGLPDEVPGKRSTSRTGGSSCPRFSSRWVSHRRTARRAA